MTSGILLHCLKGSPLYPLGHLQMGRWFLTEHSALRPQAPVQGSIHFWWEQASSLLHSSLTIHSGLQEGGEPW